VYLDRGLRADGDSNEDVGDSEARAVKYGHLVRASISL
jgi:hypothetical protein